MTMRIEPWPNGLGYDIHHSEAFPAIEVMDLPEHGSVHARTGDQPGDVRVSLPRSLTVLGSEVAADVSPAAVLRAVKARLASTTVEERISEFFL